MKSFLGGQFTIYDSQIIDIRVPPRYMYAEGIYIYIYIYAGMLYVPWCAVYRLLHRLSLD